MRSFCLLGGRYSINARVRIKNLGARSNLIGVKNILPMIPKSVMKSSSSREKQSHKICLKQSRILFTSHFLLRYSDYSIYTYIYVKCPQNQSPSNKSNDHRINHHHLLLLLQPSKENQTYPNPSNSKSSHTSTSPSNPSYPHPHPPHPISRQSNPYKPTQKNP